MTSKGDVDNVSSEASALPPKPRGNLNSRPASAFRVAGLVAHAAKKFARAINPPVEFGKHATSSSGGSQTGSEAGTPRVTSRGHKTDLLLGKIHLKDDDDQ
eukprot:TRINITY_DN17642_c0_g1_i1.p1 TRINITY_DN17642_c0_g1~~TRINITY_DN17642_c0_g1_i1.p1  ORF type:complete len:101 (-),score=12.17 TRINITY_DN17642_c0_g1_i1:504-806(-)